MTSWNNETAGNQIDASIAETSLESMEKCFDLLNRALHFIDYYEDLRMFKRPSESYEYEDEFFLPTFAVSDKGGHDLCTHTTAEDNIMPIIWIYEGTMLPRLRNYADVTYEELFETNQDEMIFELNSLDVGWTEVQKNITVCLTEYEDHLIGIQQWLKQNRMSYKPR